MRQWEQQEDRFPTFLFFIYHRSIAFLSTYTHYRLHYTHFLLQHIYLVFPLIIYVVVKSRESLLISQQ
jgi:hypothetical protein